MKVPNTFIFQAKLKDDFDLRKQIKEGEDDTFYATRYVSEMRPGDYVLFWLAGPENIRGLYGWGVLTSEAYTKPGWTDPGVDYRYQGRFKRPILAKEIKADPSLKNLLILKAPTASNFKLEPDEVERLVSFIRERGEVVPEMGGV